MPCGGVIVFRNKGAVFETIVVKTAAGHYGFPKGKCNKGETNYKAAVRELEEETGITDKMITFVEDNSKELITFKENTITYYLATLKDFDHVPKFDHEELAEVKWINVNDALKMSEFELKNIRKTILNQSFDFINSNNSDVKSNVKLSKRLSWILRWGAVELGLKVTADGSVLLDDILKLQDMRHLTLADIKDVVKNNDKQRFTMKESDGNTYIRANQGHGIDVGKNISNKQLLKKINMPFETCFHGTYRKLADTIKKTGLKTMNRKHIHLTNSLEAKSGVRSNVSAFVYIDMAMAMADGIEFYTSDNDVILTEGKDGVLDPKYISKITYK